MSRSCHSIARGGKIEFANQSTASQERQKRERERERERLWSLGIDHFITKREEKEKEKGKNDSFCIMFGS